jgi:pyrroline-5-carboxylate reductase
MGQKTVAFIGAGNMAEAIISGLVKGALSAENIITSNPTPDRLDELASKYGINTTTSNLDAAARAEVVVLAVKPQLMGEVCEELQQIDWSNKLVISIAAGISCKRIEALLSSPLKLVRVMPNTPALVNLGMSGLFANSNVTSEEKALAEMLMGSFGKYCWVNEEADINKVTAVSGSGPAYYFLFMELMQKHAMELGFDKDTARLLVQQTAKGAAQMVESNPDLEISILRERVTSKGGTTAEALATFNQHDLDSIISKAMDAAISRAEEMEKQF